MCERKKETVCVCAHASLYNVHIQVYESERPCIFCMPCHPPHGQPAAAFFMDYFVKINRLTTYISECALACVDS